MTGGDLAIGAHGGTGTGLVGGSGSVVMTGGEITVGGTLYVGEVGMGGAVGSGGTGTVSITNATMVCNNWCRFAGGGDYACGTLSIGSGGLFSSTSYVFFGSQGGRGVGTIAAGGTLSAGAIYMGEVETGGQNYGELDINGGNLNVGYIQIGWDTGQGSLGQTNFNGGTVTDLQSGELFSRGGGTGSTSHAYVLAGGVTFNTNGYAVGTGFPLLASAAGTVVKTGYGASHYGRHQHLHRPDDR